MLKKKGQEQDFPMELQVEGFDQKVVKQHSELSRESLQLQYIPEAFP